MSVSHDFEKALDGDHTLQLLTVRQALEKALADKKRVGKEYEKVINR